MRFQNREKFNKLLVIFIIFTMTLNFVVIPAMIKPLFTNESNNYNNLPTTSQFIPRNIRVAIYNEPNITEPAYSSYSLLTNNYTALKNSLLGAGYQVDELTCNEIFDHKLMTADYDVFIMVDNLPRENITNYVKEFWLGGGGILSFDSALSYLLYAGIIIPESEGSENFGLYWAYVSDTSHEVSLRYPITKDYQVDDKFASAGISMCYLDWSVLLGTSAGADTVKLANRDGFDNSATAVARDPINRGGRVVQLPGRGDYIGINMSNMIIDSVDWLCPRPKGRILFDLSHQPRLGVDNWDEYTMFPGYYSEWRDELVSRHYTFDKLFPSSLGNFTLDRLNKYNMLILVSPDYDISTSDRSAVNEWVQNGGGLLIFGEYPLAGNFGPCDTRINFLLNSFDLEMNMTYGLLNTVDATYSSIHPTTEGCTYINVNGRGAINITGEAYPIWKTSADILIAGQEYGKGRVILSSDINWLTNAQIANQDNRQYSINLGNWLTSTQAEVLIYIQDHPNPDPNDNIYNGPVAKALNDLGSPFYITFDKIYFNLSLTEGPYKLVIIDNTFYTIMDTVGISLLNFLRSGGYLILNTWTYRVATYNYLWDYLGFRYAGNYFTLPQTINIWDTTHPIFNTPAQYGASTIETSLNFATTDYTNLTLYSNATAIAGLTISPDPSTGAIILGANGHAITNAMHLTECYDDTDDSTYPDGLEIWENEIAYMLNIISKKEGGLGFPDILIYLLIGIIAVAILAVIIVIVKVKKRKK